MVIKEPGNKSKKAKDQKPDNGKREYEVSYRDSNGRLQNTKIPATNDQALAAHLRSMGVVALSIKEVNTEGLQKEIHIPGLTDKVKMKDLAVMSRQLATMVSAGLSILRALSILAEQIENQALAKIIGQVRDDVERGSSFSKALSNYPKVFPRIMINLVRAGETGGFLEDSLISIAENFEAEVKLRQQVKSAMTYPVMVLFVAIIALVVMLTFIVPVFEEMFADLDGELPAPTKFLVWLSGMMKFIIPISIILVIAFVIWWSRNKQTDAVRSKWDPIKLKLPIFGKLIQKIALARFTRNFATMLGAGVPILQALDVVGETSGNWVIENAVQDVKEDIRRGESLGVSMGRHEVFPPMLVQMVGVGEDSGSVEIMLKKVSEFYDQEVEATTAQLTSLIEPIMIVGIGVLIGGMIVALYMPMFTIYENIK